MMDDFFGIEEVKLSALSSSKHESTNLKRPWPFPLIGDFDIFTFPPVIIF